MANIDEIVARDKTWQNEATGNTPITKDDLNYYENMFKQIVAILKEGGGGAGGGHIIISADGVELVQQPKLKFINAEVTNDEANQQTIVDAKGQKGDAGTIESVSIETLDPGTQATIENTGTKTTAILKFGIPSGYNGQDGTDGNSIVSIEKTSSVGLVDTYTISFTKSQPITFTVTNGQDGSGSGDMSKSVYDTNNDGSVDNADKVGGHTVARNVANDEYTNSQIDSAISSAVSNVSVPFSKVTSRPNTLEGYGITDAVNVYYGTTFVEPTSWKDKDLFFEYEE